MDPNDPQWLEHLDVVTAWGEASAANHTPPPTDEQLWAMTRVRQDLRLPEQIDDELLAELREAFDTGRRPTRIDLQAVADAVSAHGLPARVEHTGGNTATLYAGEQILDAYGDVRWSTSAGPGWFEAPGRREPFADTKEFGVGPHDDSWSVGVAQHATTQQIADLVVAVSAEADAQLARFTETVAAARAAMWNAFATAYPDANTADLPPGLDNAVAAELRKLLTRWLDRHWPPFHVVPGQLATTLSRTDTTTSDGSP